MPYKYGMIFKGQAEPSYNSAVLETEGEADSAARELMTRWFSPIDWKVTETDDKVNSKFENHKLVFIEG